MTEITRIKGNARMSNAVIVNGIAFLKGVTPRDEAGDTVQEQTQDVLAQIEAILAGIGSDKSKLVAATIWVKNIADVPAMNEIYDAWVLSEHLPVRACVEAAMGKARYLVEVQVTATI